MTTRVAKCSCGQLSATCHGDPLRVVLCSCNACQRRTGAPYGAGAYYQRTQVSTEGASKEYTRHSDAGRWFKTHFCPECGSSVFWYLENSPDQIGVAVGAFNDPHFPAPLRAVWAESKLAWVNFPDDVPVFPRAAQPR